MLLSGGAQADRDAPDPVPARRASARFALRGAVQGLYPGDRARMPVVVRNRTRRTLELGRVSARIADAVPGCPARYLIVRRFRGERIVPARGSVRVFLKVRLRRSAPDACQAARFPLTFVAEGWSG
jgi:hypothetical protein